MRITIRVAALALVLLPATTTEPLDCSGDAPSRASSRYWDYLEVCGCDAAEPVSPASLDYERWVAVCAESLRDAARARELARALAGAKTQRKDAKAAEEGAAAGETDGGKDAAGAAAPAEPDDAAEQASDERNTGEQDGDPDKDASGAAEPGATTEE
jgi:hypothetical protein